MHHKDIERIPTAEATNTKMAQYSTTLTADTPHIKWTACASHASFPTPEKVQVAGQGC